MMESLKSLLGLVLRNKLKIAVGLLSILFFLLVLFPFDDLSDLVSAQVSKMTNNTIFLQFKKLDMSLLPIPGIRMEHVFFQAIGTPSVSLDRLTLTPSLSALIYKKPYGHVSAQGLLGGNLDLALEKGVRSEAGILREKIEVRVQKISLKDLAALGKLPIQLQGDLQLGATALADLAWKEQPEADLDLTLNRFEIPSASVNTPLGPLTLPELKLAQVLVKARLSGGNLILEKSTLGKETDDIRGTVKGSLGVTFEDRGGGTPSPVFGSYTFDIELRLKKAFLDQAAAFLILLDSYRSNTPEGALFRFKVSGANFFAPPTIGALR